MSSEESIKPPTKGFYPVEGPVRKLQYPPTIRNLKVAELMESYLEEIAKDSNLPVAKFMALIDSFSELPRDSDNCLYRTIDVYLTVPKSPAHLPKNSGARQPNLLRFCGFCLAAVQEAYGAPDHTCVLCLFICCVPGTSNIDRTGAQ
jgi:hypothetical protein